MELFVKHFSELSAQELFEIYKLRVSVFVVEQKCYYQEVDDLIFQERVTTCRSTQLFWFAVVV